MSVERRFRDGQHFEFGDVEYRIVRGRKGPDDLRLDRRFHSRWVPVTLDDTFLVVDVIADNENVLFPPPASGGGKVWKALKTALQYGWHRARHDLQLERMRRDEGDEGEEAS